MCIWTSGRLSKPALAPAVVLKHKQKEEEEGLLSRTAGRWCKLCARTALPLHVVL